MEYIVFHIPSLIIPEKEYRIDELGIIFFPSKVKSKAINNSFSSLGIMIFNEELKLKYVQNFLTDIVSFLSICQPDFYSYRWLSQHRFNKPDFEKMVLKCKTPNDILPELVEKKPNCFELKDYSSFTYSHDNFKTVINIADQFNKFRRLKNNDRLKNLFKLFSFIRNCDPLVAKVYNNGNLKISLMFTILDEIIPKKEVDKEIKCNHCETIHIEKRQPKMKDRINQFVSELSVEQKENDLLKKILNHMCNIRNDFFHEAIFDTTIEKINKLSKITGRHHFTIDDEVEYIEGRLSGILWVEHIMRIILFNKLSEVELARCAEVE